MQANGVYSQGPYYVATFISLTCTLSLRPVGVCNITILFDITVNTLEGPSNLGANFDINCLEALDRWCVL